MPNITRIVGMHNQVDEANADKVWAGLVLRLDDGQYQFVALYGPRGGRIREARQSPTSSFRANQKFDQMQREKLAHGYHTVDWEEGRYGLGWPIRQQGTVLSTARAEEPTPRVRTAQVREVNTGGGPVPAPVRPPMVVPVAPAQTPAELSEYIRQHTAAPEPAPEPKPEAPKGPPIRRARRLDF